LENARELKIDVNGEVKELSARPHYSLLQLLRDELGLVGPKKGCDTGGCGCCSVLIDGKVSYSCMIMALSCEGRKITTIEGLNRNGKPDPLQEAFVESGAVQCGYCIPGMIMAAKELLTRNRSPSELEIREAIAGNLCRCTGYQKIIEAIQLASVKHRQRK
jgi:carbon-monoxide dehydrogenase small subunit